MVISWAWKRRKVVRKLDRQAIGEVELNSGSYDATIH